MPALPRWESVWAMQLQALFDDVEDILGAEAAGLVTVTRLGVVVLCPIISEQGAEAPGNNELSEDFPRPWPVTLPCPF